MKLSITIAVATLVCVTVGIVVYLYPTGDYAEKCSIAEASLVQCPVPLKEGQVLAVVTQDGIGVVWFPNFKQASKRSVYEWRYRPYGHADEVSGDGYVVEKYLSKETGPGEYELTDDGTQDKVVIGSVRLAWSWGSTEFGWIYCNVPNVDVRVFDVGVSLEEVNLHHLTPFTEKTD